MSIRTQPSDIGHAAGRSWVPDALLVLVILAAWLPAAWWITGGKRVAWYDTFRDMAWAENMRAGRIWADPVVHGQSWWYAPGGPLMMAGIVSLSGRSVADVYGTSAVWLNAWIPVAIYVLVRVAWGRGTGLLALVMVFLGSYWWYTHAAAPIPGIQAVTLMLLVLLCWHLVATRGGHGVWAVLAGAGLAVCTWCHPVCGIVAALTILLHSVYDTARRPPRTPEGARVPLAARAPLLRSMLMVAGVAAALTVPLIVHMAKLHARNPSLLEFAAPEIAHPAFYAQAYTPLIVPAALLGAWVILRYTPQASWAVAYFFATLALQLPAYVAQSKHLDIPFLLPHEMQWHMQLAEGLCAAVGIVWLARAIAAKTARLTPVWAMVLAAVCVAPVLWQSLRQDEYFIDLDHLLESTGEVRAWIESHTSLEDTIACHPELGYSVVSGLTGRKCIAVSRGHMNPKPDVGRRYLEAEERLSPADPTAAATVARKYGARYLLFMFSSPEAAAAGVGGCNECTELELCFASADGRAFVYGVRPEAQR